MIIMCSLTSLDHVCSFSTDKIEWTLPITELQGRKTYFTLPYESMWVNEVGQRLELLLDRLWALTSVERSYINDMITESVQCIAEIATRIVGRTIRAYATLTFVEH